MQQGRNHLPSKITDKKVKVEVLKDGPLMVHGPLSVMHDDGREEQKSRTTAFCRCGKSGNKPFATGRINYKMEVTVFRK